MSCTAAAAYAVAAAIMVSQTYRLAWHGSGSSSDDAERTVASRSSCPRRFKAPWPSNCAVRSMRCCADVVDRLLSAHRSARWCSPIPLGDTASMTSLCTRRLAASARLPAAAPGYLTSRPTCPPSLRTRIVPAADVLAHSDEPCLARLFCGRRKPDR